ncbi:hypothetical protein EGR_08318 [Echinococcus granulosus]|uniref:Uncharacterized protein n=1 Tax=Echinococcus granulosus TaxID=6210 RepID=W6UTY2_ECHGR|nr:hypothetical protein EGR_08318 [Echinococcus granulosus]EUB56849.1 hypothetical protein EGR_08318 [Echinococcus granulosus]
MSGMTTGPMELEDGGAKSEAVKSDCFLITTIAYSFICARLHSLSCRIFLLACSTIHLSMLRFFPQPLLFSSS